MSELYHALENKNLSLVLLQFLYDDNQVLTVDSLFKKVRFFYSIFQISGADAYVCNKSQRKLFPDQVKCCIMLKLLKKIKLGI